MAYNGFKNQETWSFYHFIMNDEDDYERCVELVKASDVFALRRKLETWALDMADDALSSYEYTHAFIKDAVNATLSKVDFYEVAETLMEDMKELKEV